MTQAERERRKRKDESVKAAAWCLAGIVALLVGAWIWGMWK